MKKLITGYNFNSNSGVIQLTQYSGLTLENFLLVTNVTQNKIIYNFADSTAGGYITGTNNNSLKLNYQTSGIMSNADDLQIFYDDGVSPASDDTVTALLDVANTLKRISKNMESLQVVDANQRQRVAVEALPTLSTVTTVNQLANVDARFLYTDLARIAADSLRTKLTFT